MTEMDRLILTAAALDTCQWAGLLCDKPCYMGTAYCAAHVELMRERRIAEMDGDVVPVLEDLTDAEREDLVRLGNENRMRSYENEKAAARMIGNDMPPAPAEFTADDLEEMQS